MTERPWTVRPRDTQNEAGVRRDETPAWATCPNCDQPFEACVCVCFYCGESRACMCCIGYETATGG